MLETNSKKKNIRDRLRVYMNLRKVIDVEIIFYRIRKAIALHIT
jgi:hypothetical protein